MAKTGLGKLYPFTTKQIDAVVEEGRIGVYVLGYITAKKRFRPEYVGRSDTCLNRRLHEDRRDPDLAERLDGRLEQFKFDYYPTTRAAFEKECTIWHDFRQLQETQKHPDKPNGTNYQCPVCGHPVPD